MQFKFEFNCKFMQIFSRKLKCIRYGKKECIRHIDSIYSNSVIATETVYYKFSYKKNYKYY